MTTTGTAGVLSPPVGMIEPMRSETITFSSVVRAVAHEARRMGLAVPVFRSPPGVGGADRTICRRHGSLVVAVRLRDRPFADVVADVVEGILVANAVAHGSDLPLRRRLLRAVEVEVLHAA